MSSIGNCFCFAKLLALRSCKQCLTLILKISFSPPKLLKEKEPSSPTPHCPVSRSTYPESFLADMYSSGSHSFHKVAKVCYPHFIAKETEIVRSCVLCRRSRAESRANSEAERSVSGASPASAASPLFELP